MKLVSDWKERRELMGEDVVVGGRASDTESELSDGSIDDHFICGCSGGCIEWKGFSSSY